MMHGWNTDGGVPLTGMIFVVWSKRSQRSWLREGSLGKDASGDLMKSELESVHGGWESWIHLSWVAKKDSRLWWTNPWLLCCNRLLTPSWSPCGRIQQLQRSQEPRARCRFHLHGPLSDQDQRRASRPHPDPFPSASRFAVKSMACEAFVQSKSCGALYIINRPKPTRTSKTNIAVNHFARMFLVLVSNRSLGLERQISSWPDRRPPGRSGQRVFRLHSPPRGFGPAQYRIA